MFPVTRYGGWYQQEGATHISRLLNAAGSRLVLQTLRCIPQGSGAHNPETDVVVLVIRVVVIAIGNCGVGRIVVPTAAPYDAVRARSRSHSIT